MNKLRVWLSGLLAVQFLLAGVVFVASQTEEEFADDEYLVPINVDLVNKLVIDSSEGSITLVKDGERWLMPEAKNLPAHAGKVKFVLTDLYELKNTWPLTTTTSAHDRFEVGDEVFKRRVTIYQEGLDEEVVYIGTSPSFRKSHFRPQGDDNVYAMNLNVNDFYDNASDWLDKRLLTVESVTSIKGLDYELVKDGDNWKVKQPGESALVATQTAKVDEMVAVLANMELLEIAAPEMIPEFSGEDYHQIIVSDGSQEWVYDLKRDVAEYFIKRDDINEVFTMSKMEFKDLSAYHYEDLVDPQAAQPAESE